MSKKKVPTLISIIFMYLNFSIQRILTLDQIPYSGAKIHISIDDTVLTPDVSFERSISNTNSPPVVKDLCIETFTSVFTTAAYSSAVLSDLFNLSQTTPSALSKFLHDDAHAILSNHNIPNPHIIATSLTQPITDSFEQLTLPLVVKVYAKAMAKFLFSEGVLNEWNATTLALAYAKEMQNNANLHVVAGNSESKFKAMSNGYKKFLKSFGLFIPEKFADIASGFGNEMKLNGNQFGKGASITLS